MALRFEERVTSIDTKISDHSFNQVEKKNKLIHL